MFPFAHIFTSLIFAAVTGVAIWAASSAWAVGLVAGWLSSSIYVILIGLAVTHQPARMSRLQVSLQPDGGL